MDLRLMPDPARPEGGHALLQFRDGPIDPSLELWIRDLRQDRWLAGGWRSEQAPAGVFDAADAGGGMRQISLGPDIVDRVEIDSYLEFRLGSLTARAVWPDSILPSPRAGGAGAVGAGEPTRPEPGGAGPLTGVVAPGEPPPEPEEPAPKPEPEPPRGEPEGVGAAQEGPGKRGRAWLMVLLLAAAAVLAGAAWFLTQAPEEESRPALDCGDEGFRNRWSASFDDQYRALVECLGAGDVSPSLALRVLDSGIAAENPDALLIYAQLYDADASPGTEVPVDFEPNVLRAVEYYARARAAGNADAGAGLERTCAALRPDEDLLHESVFASHCR